MQEKNINTELWENARDLMLKMQFSVARGHMAELCVPCAQNENGFSKRIHYFERGEFDRTA